MEFHPVHIEPSNTKNKVEISVSNKFGVMLNVTSTYIHFELDDCRFVINLVEKDGKWVAKSLAHVYNYENENVYCPFCKKRNPSSIDCKEAVPYLDELYEAILKELK